MRIKSTIAAVLGVLLLLAGCGKKAATTGSQSAPAAAQATMTAWKEGDREAAISNFVATAWSSSPLFPSSSPLSLTEAQFKSLSSATQPAKQKEILAQLESLKALGTVIVQTGRAASANGDNIMARKYFTALKDFATALQGPDNMSVVQLVGKSFRTVADTEMGKLPK